MPSCSLWRHCNVYVPFFVKSESMDYFMCFLEYECAKRLKAHSQASLDRQCCPFGEMAFDLRNGVQNPLQSTSVEVFQIISNLTLFNSFFRITTKKTLNSTSVAICVGNPPVTGGFPTQRVTYVERHLIVMLSCSAAQGNLWEICLTLCSQYCCLLQTISLMIFSS